MNGTTFATSVAAISQVDCLALWRATWQGGLATLAVWGICRVFPRLPAAVRCWLWRLALIKFVVTLLVPLAVVPLPVLRAAHSPNPASATAILPLALPRLNMPTALSTSRTQPAAAIAAGAAPESADFVKLPLVKAQTAVEQPSQHGRVANIADTGLSTTPVPLAAGRSQPADPALAQTLAALCTVIFVIYLGGIAFFTARLMRSAVLTRRFLKVPRRPIEEPEVQSAAADLCRQLGIARIPRIVDAPDVAASQLVAAVTPVILLPVLSESLQVHLNGQAARRLMLAHELAHLRRGDLWWSGFSALAQTLFFFNPLLWLARREEEMAREMACDALVLATTHASAATYGAVLVEAAASWRPGLPKDTAVMSLGIANETRPIRQRLLALRNAKPHCSARRLRALTAIVGVAAALVFLPWRVVAAGRHSVTDSPSATVVSKLGSAVVEGHVLLLPDNESGANCSVTLEPLVGVETARKPSVVLTDVAGRYHFDTVPQGTYLLSAQSASFWGARCLANVPGKSGVRITIGADRSAVEQDLLLTKISVAVVGRVVDTRTRQSVSEAQVGVGSVEGGPESVNLWESVRGDGRYGVYAAPGRAALYVRYHHFEPRVMPKIHLDDAWINPYRLVAEDTAHLAKIVTIEPGHAVEANIHVNAHYVPAANSLAPITGHVIGTDGRPAAMAEVYIFNIKRMPNQLQYPATLTVVRTDADGQFQVDGIPASWAGTRLDIRVRGARESDGVSSQYLVSLPITRHSSGKLAPLTIHLAANLSIIRLGRVVGVNGRPTAHALVDLHLRSDKGELLWANDQTITDADGGYRFTRLWPDLNEGWTSATPGFGSSGTLFTRDSAKPQANKAVETDPIVLTPTTFKLAGVIVTATGRPVPNARIFAIGGLKNGGGGAAITDSQGRFRVDELHAGSYHVGYSGREADGRLADGNTSAIAGNLNLRWVLKRRPTKPSRTPTSVSKPKS